MLHFLYNLLIFSFRATPCPCSPNSRQQCSALEKLFFFSFLKKGGGREKQQGPQFFSRFNFHITHVSTYVCGLEGSHGMGMSQASDKITSVVPWSAFYSGD